MSFFCYYHFSRCDENKISISSKTGMPHITVNSTHSLFNSESKKKKKQHRFDVVVRRLITCDKGCPYNVLLAYFRRTFRTRTFYTAAYKIPLSITIHVFAARNLGETFSCFLPARLLCTYKDID
jgi:hypothetical protein